MPFFLRRLVGRFTFIFRPCYAYCGRCLRGWGIVPIEDVHFTPYRENTSVGVLCEACFKDLTPIQRLEYYNIWMERNMAQDDWEDLRTAVLKGE